MTSDEQAERIRALERANGEMALLWAEANDTIEAFRAAAKAVLACGVGNLSGPKYRRRVEAFDGLDDALEASDAPLSTLTATRQSGDTYLLEGNGT